ncbi:M12 family metallo-peptidase [Marinilongibacter aquaticus]|uniref:M12 family metallo-peptidase n=1 Tax=Marinilongibacter aquaticus TaxID=2975157 RepID=UPI0021BDED87|nr:M12 family metallo-peptidase [Marinilongibacter aquaticus]UBM58179.1 M12 family metallo-peptidase [Marinilongibacter aquaticus]
MKTFYFYLVLSSFLLVDSKVCFGQHDLELVLEKDDFQMNKDNAADEFELSNTFHVMSSVDFHAIKYMEEFDISIRALEKKFIGKVEKVKIPEYALEHSESSIDTVHLDNFIALRGELSSEKGSIRILLFDDNNIEGVISTESEQFTFEYLGEPRRGAQTLFYSGSMQELVPNSCTLENSAKGSLSKIDQSNLKLLSGTCGNINIAVTADYEFYSTYGSQSASKMISNINSAEAGYHGIYNPFNLYFSITNVSYWTTSSDPYPNTNDAQTALNYFRNYWNANKGNIPRDYAQLFSGKTFNGTSPQVLGITGTIGSACTDPTNSYIVVAHRTNIPALQQTNVTIHEIGHYLGAQHYNNLCGYQGLGSIMCNGIYDQQWVWYSPSINEINTKLNSTTCLTQPNIFPTVNGTPYTGTTTLCGYNTILSLNNNTGSSYSWYVDPSNLSGNGSFTAYGDNATVNITGFYILAGKMFDNCSYSSSNHFYLNPCAYSSNISVYPNRAIDFIDVEINDRIANRKESIFVFDSIGNRVEVISEVEKISQNKIRLHLKNNLDGIYYLHILNNNKFNSFRVLIQQ